MCNDIIYPDNVYGKINYCLKIHEIRYDIKTFKLVYNSKHGDHTDNIYLVNRYNIYYYNTNYT